MKLKNKPKAGMKLHTFIALGGKPSDFKGAKKNPAPKKK